MVTSLKNILFKFKPSFTPDAWRVFLYFSIFPLVPMIYSRLFVHRREEEFIFVFLISILLMTPLLLGKFANRKYVFFVGFIQFLFGLIDLVHCFIFKGSINKQIFYIMFDTNIGESKAFVNDFISTGTVLGVVAYFVVYLLLSTKLFKRTPLIFPTNYKPLMAIFVLLPLLIKAISFDFNKKKTLDLYVRSNQALSAFVGIIEYQEQMKIIKEASAGLVKKELLLKRSIEINEPETHVLLIGESLGQSHMSLYGYSRKTTPRLDAMKNELNVFQNVQCTDPPSTLANLQKVFTLHESSSKDFSGLGTSIIDVFKTVGFRTYWLSNQGILGQHTSVTTALSQGADERVFTSTTHRFDLDERLNKPIDKVINDKKFLKKFIVIHIQGNHNTYSHRYSKEFAVFDGQDSPYKRKFHNKKKVTQINEYDNSVLYNDNFVANIINRLKNIQGNVSFIYLPDHGEELYETVNGQGHGNIGKPTKALFKIPFILWQNDLFETTRGYSKKFLEPMLSRDYTSDILLHSLMDLYGVVGNIYEPNKSIFSENLIRVNLPYKGKD